MYRLFYRIVSPFREILDWLRLNFRQAVCRWRGHRPPPLELMRGHYRGKFPRTVVKYGPCLRCGELMTDATRITGR